MRRCVFAHEEKSLAAFRRNITGGDRFKMLTGWLTLTAFLAASADLSSAALTVAPTCRVKGHPDKQLTLHCGDGKHAGVVQYWHTPFGDLEAPGFLSELDPVFMHHDGSLVVPNSSLLHSGLYYCILQHKRGTTLWPYQVHVGHNNEKDDDHHKSGQHRCGSFRFKRDVGLKEQKQGGVSDSHFAGAVAASVLVTFVLGFSAGALTRTQVLRCLGDVTSRLRSPRQRRQPDTVDHGSKVTMTGLPPMYDNQAFEMEQVLEDDSVNFGATESTMSSTTSTPPAKPKRSFRQKREEVQETTAYLEGCDYEKVEEEEEQGSLKEINMQCDGVEKEEGGFSGFYLPEKDGGSQTETEEDDSSEDQGEQDGRESNKETRLSKEEEEVEEAGELDMSGMENEKESRGSEEEVEDGEGKGIEDKMEDEEGWREKKEGDHTENKAREEDVDSDDSRHDEEADDDTEDETMKTHTEEGEARGELSGPLPSRGRRSRVIRLYQYDEDGQRYGHLPKPAPDEQGPAPKLKQRSLSLTRLSAIMAAASAGPMDTKETGGEEREERPHFHMEI